MASTILGLSALVAQNDQNLDPVYVTDLLQAAPFMAALHSKPASNGTLHKYLKTTAGPAPGFRAVGSGRDHTTYTQATVTATLKYMDASFHVDKAFADGHMLGIDAVMEQHGQESLKAAFAAVEKQLIYGTGALGNADGFAGLVQNTAIDALDDAMVVNAGSSAVDATTSVYGVYTNDGDVALVAGTTQSGQMLSVGPRTEQFVPDVDGKLYAAYASAIGMWLGMQYGSAYSLGRLCNIGAAANKLTDALIASLLAKFPVDKRPSFWLMSRQSLFQLQASRTATNQTGAPAPIPTESFGIPIVVSEQVVNTEPVVA